MLVTSHTLSKMCIQTSVKCYSFNLLCYILQCYVPLKSITLFGTVCVLIILLSLCLHIRTKLMRKIYTVDKIWACSLYAVSVVEPYSLLQ